MMLRPPAFIQALIFVAFISLIGLSPSLNLIPKSLFITNFHDSQRLFELLLIILVLLHGIIISRHAAATNQIIRFATYILIALATVSSSLAYSPRHAFIEISLFSGLFYLSLFVMQLYQTDHALLIKRLVYVFWGGILLVMVSFYVGYITANIFNTPVVWPAPLKAFTNIRSFNQYQLWTLGLITLPLLAFDFKRASTLRWLHIGLISWWVLLFFSASRGALLAWAVGIVCTAIIYKKTAWPFIRLQLMHITAGFLSYQLLFQVIPSYTKSTVVTGTILRESTNDRIELWKLALNLIQDHPIFGVGPMHFAWASSTSAHPHNSVLQLMAEWGLPAALIILSMAGYGLVCWLKRFDIKKLQTQTKFNQNLIIALFFSLITGAAYSLVDGVIAMPVSQVMMFTIIGLMIGLYSDGHLIEVKRAPLFRLFFAGIVLIALVWSTLPEIVQGVTGSKKHFSIGYTAAGPRIWSEVK